MLFKVNEDIIQVIQENLSFLRFNESTLHYVEELYFSKDGRLQSPWSDNEPTIIYRLMSSWDVDKSQFESNPEVFLSTTKDLFDDTLSKTFQQVHHLFLLGKKDSLQMTELSNWKVQADFLELQGLQPYLRCCKYVVNIPCSTLNLNVIKLIDTDEFFVELSEIKPSPSLKQDVIKKLHLVNEVNETLVERVFNRLTSEVS